MSASSSPYTKEGKLGEGTYSCLVRARDNRNGESVILKLFRTDGERDGIPSSLIREMGIVRSLHHVNIIEFKDAVYEGGVLSLAFEPLDMTLRSYLSHTGAQIPLDLIRSYSYQLLCACYCLHSRGIIHQNICPDHIMIDRAGFLKISDFHTSLFSYHPYPLPENEMTTLGYRAPELLFDNPIYGFHVDLWSAGCLIAEFVTGGQLFGGDSPVDQLMKILAALGPPSREDWPGFYAMVNNEIRLPSGPYPGLAGLLRGAPPDLIDLLSKLLAMNPERRITAREAVRHPFFGGVPAILTELCLDSIGE
jgi:serine/threonine protein kinase